MKKSTLLKIFLIYFMVVALSLGAHFLTNNKIAAQETVGCGWTFRYQEKKCDCNGVDEDGIIMQPAGDTNNRCCGEMAGGSWGPSRCVDPNTGEPPRIEYQCGEVFEYHVNARCMCGRTSRMPGLGPTSNQYCCGWVVEGQCYATKEEADLVDEAFRLCRQAGDQEDICLACSAAGGVWTALGCIPTNADQMIQVIIRIGLLIAGGIATLIILAGSFMLSVSQGDPQKTTEAKEMITAAIIGLVFIIFSVSILQLIGVQILQIPEFGQ